MPRTGAATCTRVSFAVWAEAAPRSAHLTTSRYVYQTTTFTFRGLTTLRVGVETGQPAAEGNRLDASTVQAVGSTRTRSSLRRRKQHEG